LESNERYFARRAVEEMRAAARAVTPEARARRRALAEAFQLKAEQFRGVASDVPASPIFESGATA
jgi:hypothetical protein